MVNQVLTRKQSAVISADVYGFTRLMSRNDVLAVQTINHHRYLMARLIGRNQGRVVDMAGDSILAVFQGAEEAVRCGLAMQERLWANNRWLPSAERMCFRLGIDMGSVLHQGERVYGNAVNIAARLQEISQPGGVVVSSSVYDEVRDKIPLAVECLGRRSLKNISEPVMVYRLLPVQGGCCQDCVNSINDTAVSMAVS